MCATIHLPTCTLMHMHTHVYIYMHTCTYAHSHMHTNIHAHLISLNYLSMDAIAPHTGDIVSDRLNKHILLIISKCIHKFHNYINVTMIVIHNQP